VHLLVKDVGGMSISKSMQLIAGRVAQEFNQRKSRRGAFWEDRYFATAISTDHHLIRCLVYIDLNMVRAGVVRHPAQWKVCGFNDIQSPRLRYRIIDFEAWCKPTGATSVEGLRRKHLNWVNGELGKGNAIRQPEWTESFAVGPDSFKRKFQNKNGHFKPVSTQND
jgi:putative transposase